MVTTPQIELPRLLESLQQEAFDLDVVKAIENFWLTVVRLPPPERTAPAARSEP